MQNNKSCNMSYKLYNTVNDQRLRLAPLDRFNEDFTKITQFFTYETLTVDYCKDVTIEENCYWFPVIGEIHALAKSALQQKYTRFYADAHKVYARKEGAPNGLNSTTTIGEIPQPFRLLLPKPARLRFGGNIDEPYFYFFWSENRD